MITYILTGIFGSLGIILFGKIFLGTILHRSEDYYEKRGRGGRKDD